MLNNEMDDFATSIGASNLYGAIGGAKNLVTPLKRPLSSMSPTLVLKKGEPFMALGTPSGTRIVSCVAQTLLNVLEYDLPLWDAMTLTRYHHQWKPDVLQIEASGLPSSTMKALKKMGYDTIEKSLGCRVQAVQKRNHELQGVSDPREEGASQGL
jgi:gamma-glutamyltranspeptidase / glutathione hydrolase